VADYPFIEFLKAITTTFLDHMHQTSAVRLTAGESEWSLLSCLAHDCYFIVLSWLESMELPE